MGTASSRRSCEEVSSKDIVPRVSVDDQPVPLSPSIVTNDPPRHFDRGPGDVM